MSVLEISNAHIADMLDEVADLRDQQDANPYRVRSYRRAAATIRDLDEPASSIFEREGVDGLKRLPGIGERLAGAIRDILESGKRGQHEGQRVVRGREGELRKQQSGG